MTDGDRKAHNALTAVQAFYGDVLTRDAGERAQEYKAAEVLVRQVATLSSALTDKQKKAGEACKLLESLPPVDDRFYGVASTLDAIGKLLRAIAAPETKPA